MNTVYQGCSLRATVLFVIVIASPLWLATGVEGGMPYLFDFGECSYTTNMPGLEIEKISGVWFIQENVPSEYTLVKSCSVTNFTWEGDSMKVVEKGLDVDGRKIRQKSYIRPSPPPNEGEYQVEAEGVPAAPYQIISTDYKNYACVYSCLSIMGIRASFTWIYTRQPFPDPSLVEKCRDIFTEKEIDLKDMQPMKQDETCPYMSKLQGIKSYMDSLNNKQRKLEDATVKPTTTTIEPEDVSSINDVTFAEEENKHFEDLESRVTEKEGRLQWRVEEERRQQEEERSRIEGDRTKLEEERMLEEAVSKEKEDRREQRQDVRGYHGGNRHKQEIYLEVGTESGTSSLSFSISTLVMALLVMFIGALNRH